MEAKRQPFELERPIQKWREWLRQHIQRWLIPVIAKAEEAELKVEENLNSPGWKATIQFLTNHQISLVQPVADWLEILENKEEQLSPTDNDFVKSLRAEWDRYLDVIITYNESVYQNLQSFGHDNPFEAEWSKWTLFQVADNPRWDVIPYQFYTAMNFQPFHLFPSPKVGQAQKVGQKRKVSSSSSSSKEEPSTKKAKVDENIWEKHFAPIEKIGKQQAKAWHLKTLHTELSSLVQVLEGMNKPIPVEEVWKELGGSSLFQFASSSFSNLLEGARAQVKKATELAVQAWLEQLETQQTNTFRRTARKCRLLQTTRKVDGIPDNIFQAIQKLVQTDEKESKTNENEATQKWLETYQKRQDVWEALERSALDLVEHGKEEEEVRKALETAIADDHQTIVDLLRKHEKEQTNCKSLIQLLKSCMSNFSSQPVPDFQPWKEARFARLTFQQIDEQFPNPAEEEAKKQLQGLLTELCLRLRRLQEEGWPLPTNVANAISSISNASWKTLQDWIDFLQTLTFVLNFTDAPTGASVHPAAPSAGQPPDPPKETISVPWIFKKWA